MPAEQRIATLQGYGFTVTASPAASAQPDLATLWSTLVTQHGPDWATYTGTEQSWAEHRDRFYINANQLDPSAYELAYQQLSPLDSMPAEQRIATLQGYGFTVTASPAASAQPDLAMAAEGPSQGEPTTDWSAIPEDIAVDDLARLLEEAAAEA
jgi:hypothetical protein